MTTRFVPWYPVATAADHAPVASGVFQIKLPRVIDYPTGKSAMIRYGASDDVRAALVAVAAQHPDAPWLARHAERDDGAALSPAERDALLADLLAQFRRRFGAEPRLPSVAP